MSMFESRNSTQVDPTMYHQAPWDACGPTEEVLYGFHGTSWMPYVHRATPQSNLTPQDDYPDGCGVAFGSDAAPYAQPEYGVSSNQYSYAECSDNEFNAIYDTHDYHQPATTEALGGDVNVYRSVGMLYGDKSSSTTNVSLSKFPDHGMTYDLGRKTHETYKNPTMTLSDEYRASVARHSNAFHASSISQLNGLGGAMVQHPNRHRNDDHTKSHDIYDTMIYDSSAYDNGSNFVMEGGSMSPSEEYKSNQISRHEPYSPDASSLSPHHYVAAPVAHNPIPGESSNVIQSPSHAPVGLSQTPFVPHAPYVSDPRGRSTAPPAPTRSRDPARKDVTRYSPASSQSRHSESHPHDSPPHDSLRQQEPWMPLPWPGSSQSVLKLNPIKRNGDKKQALACLFCRERKIACGRPDASNADPTCNQCARRQITCEYPKESRRGQHKRRRKSHDVNDAEPTILGH